MTDPKPKVRRFTFQVCVETWFQSQITQFLVFGIVYTNFNRICSYSTRAVQNLICMPRSFFSLDQKQVSVFHFLVCRRRRTQKIGLGMIYIVDPYIIDRGAVGARAPVHGPLRTLPRVVLRLGAERGSSVPQRGSGLYSLKIFWKFEFKILHFGALQKNNFAILHNGLSQLQLSQEHCMNLQE